MRKTETRTIGAHQYKVHQLGANEGRRVLGRLLKIVGPLLGAADSGSAKGKVNEMAALKAVMGAVENLKDEDVDYFCDTFGKNSEAKVGNGWPTVSEIFDAHFAGEYAEMLGWLKFCIEVNFGSFFRQAIDQAKGKEPPSQETPIASESS